MQQRTRAETAQASTPMPHGDASKRLPSTSAAHARAGTAPYTMPRVSRGGCAAAHAARDMRVGAMAATRAASASWYSISPHIARAVLRGAHELRATVCAPEGAPHSARTASSAPHAAASRSIPSSMHTVLSTSKHTAVAARHSAAARAAPAMSVAHGKGPLRGDGGSEWTPACLPPGGNRTAAHAHSHCAQGPLHCALCTPMCMA